MFLAARNYLSDVCCPLPVVRFSLLNYFFSRCFLLAAWFLFLVACCSPLANFCFKFAVHLLCSSLLSLLATDRLRFICVSRCLLITVSCSLIVFRRSLGATLISLVATLSSSFTARYAKNLLSFYLIQHLVFEGLGPGIMATSGTFNKKITFKSAVLYSSLLEKNAKSQKFSIF